MNKVAELIQRRNIVHKRPHPNKSTKKRAKQTPNWSKKNMYKELKHHQHTTTISTSKRPNQAEIGLLSQPRKNSAKTMWLPPSTNLQVIFVRNINHNKAYNLWNWIHCWIRNRNYNSKMFQGISTRQWKFKSYSYPSYISPYINNKHFF